MTTANQTYAEEEAFRHRIQAGRADMEAVIEEAHRQMQQNLTMVFEESKRMIATINQMDHLSAQEKDRRIQEVKRRMSAQMNQIQQRANNMVQRQKNAMLGLDNKNKDVRTLEERARLIAQGAFHTMPREKLMEQ